MKKVYSLWPLLLLLLSWQPLQALPRLSVAACPNSRPLAPSLLSFTLVNADTQQDIGPLTDGAVLNLVTLPTRNVTVRANPGPDPVGSVVFSLSGTQVYTHTESLPPYALFGDNQDGIYTPWTPAVGAYTLTATPYAEAGGAGAADVPLSVSFRVVDPAAPALATFTLVDADTGADIRTLASGDVLNLTTLPTHNLNIRANPSSATVASVVFDLSGTQAYTRTENLAPYALFGDNQAGTYYPWAPAVGSYTLSAVPYTATDAGGTVGTPLSISFRVIEPIPTVTSYTLVDADTGNGIRDLVSGDVLNLNTLPTKRLNVRANTDPPTVGSVIFDLTGPDLQLRIENIPPYALIGDSAGFYGPWIPSLGNYSLTTTPYTASNGEGLPGTALSITFSVVAPSTPLPIKLTSFTAKAQGSSSVHLQWTTASEENNKEFLVQRSPDGKAFTTLATIAGKGTTTSVHTYDYTDTRLTPNAALLYYRLQQVDTDGTSVFSPLRVVTLPKAPEVSLQVYPTLVLDGKLHYVVLGVEPAAGALEVLNMLGQSLGHYPIGKDGEGTVSVKGLPTGTYVLRCLTPTSSHITRFQMP